MTRLWNHFPNLSAPPIQRHLSCSRMKNNNLDEYGIFQLENSKYAFLHFCGVKDNPDLGFTEIEEFDTLDEALEFFEVNFSLEEE